MPEFDRRHTVESGREFSQAQGSVGDVGGDDPVAVACQQQGLDSAAGADVGGHTHVFTWGDGHQCPAGAAESEHELAVEDIGGGQGAMIGHEVEVLIPGTEAARDTDGKIIGGQRERGGHLVVVHGDQPRLGGGVEGLPQQGTDLGDRDGPVEVEEQRRSSHRTVGGRRRLVIQYPGAVVDGGCGVVAQQRLRGRGTPELAQPRFGVSGTVEGLAQVGQRQISHRRILATAP